MKVLSAMLAAAAVQGTTVMSCTMPMDDYDYTTLEANGLVRPPNFWIEGVVPFLHGNKIQGYETPIAVYQTMIIDQIMWECVAAYDSNAVSVLTFERPPYIGHMDHHDSEARTICMVHAINHVLQGGLVPDAAMDFSNYVDSLCLDSTIPNEDDLAAAVEAGENDPYCIGHAIGTYFLDNMRESGWNFDGALNKHGEECSGDCMLWGDSGPDPYTPEHSPFDPPMHDKYYQPLLENNERGFEFAQSHVTPHIGHRVKPIIFREPIFSAEEINMRASIPDPEYDLDEEADLAIEEVRQTGESDFRKIMVEFMDNKINLAGGLIMRVRQEFSLSLEEQLMYHVGYTTAEHDSIVLAWREKVAHDLVRPTTIVQARGNEYIESYRGPFKGVGGMRARDWHPYIRTMPHAEYPSGSGCICTVVAEYLDAWIQDQHNQQTFPTMWEFQQGSSKTEPMMVPAANITQSFNTMTELRDMCGESRLWGGMHFRASVQASYDLCEGIGTRAYTNWSRMLLPNTPLSALFDDAEKFVPM